MSIALSRQPFIAPELSEAIPDDCDDRIADAGQTDDDQHSWGGAFVPRAVLGEYNGGPGLMELATPIHLFLQKWSLRRWSVWQEELASRAWRPWQAQLVVRVATFLWMLVWELVVALAAVIMLLSLAWVSGR